MIININEEIDNTSLINIMDALNNFDIHSDSKLIIYINSVGGRVDIADAIVDIINNNKEKIILIGYGRLFSSGFMIFFEAQCEKKLLDYTIGMVHQSSIKLHINENGKPSNEDKFENFIFTEQKKSKSGTLKKLKTLGLTEDELASVNNGEDVFFTTKRLKELIKWQQS